MARDDDLDLERARRRHRYTAESSTTPPTSADGAREPHPSENLEFATVPPTLNRLDTRPHPSELMEFATVSPALSPMTTRHSMPPASRSPSNAGPHPSEELEFATIPPTLSSLDTRPQSIRSRDFASMSSARSPMDNRHIPLSPSPSSSSSGRPHPSENVQFSTVPTNISGFEHGPHPSEELEFTTVPSAISGLGQIKTNTTEAIDFANVFSSGRSERSPSDAADLSSITSKPKATHVEYAYDGSPSPPNNLERRNTLESVELGVKQRVNSVNELMMRLAQGIPGLNLQDAKKAAQKEQKMTLGQGLRQYPKAIGWSLMLSFTLVMEGYDLSIINGFFAFPVFKRRFGHLTPSGYEITTAWQAGLGNGAVVGEILGLLSNGIITERVGYRKCLIYALIWLCLAIFLAFFSQGIAMLMTSEVLCGLSWGVFQTLSTTYAAEVMPVTLRAYLTSNVNLCWLIGQVIGLGILRGTVGWRDEWSYRLPFGLQWMWAIPILVGTFLAPESPWWLVRRERYQDAKHSLKRLTSKGSDSNIDETIAMMRHTNEVEKYLTAGTSYWDCLKGVDLRRTEIVCMVWIIQTLSGSPMTGFSAYFFTRAGFNAKKAFDLSTGMYGLAIIAHMFALVLMRYAGRRKMYMFGCAAMSVTLFIAGGVGCLHETPGTQWTLGALIILMTFFYDLTIGPVCYSLVAEIPSTRLRIKTVVLGRIAYNIAGILSNVLMPQMLNPEAWNLKGKTCFLWAVTALLSLVWCYYRLPEPKGLTYIELDILFQKKASAKKFRAFQVNLADRGYFELQERKDEDKHWEGVA